MIGNYITTAWRTLRSNYAYAIINTCGLALSICCCIVIYVFVDYETSFDAFHTDAERIYRVVHLDHTSDGTQYWNTTAYPLAEALRDDFPALDVAQTAGPMTRLISSEENGELRRFEIDKLLFADRHYLRLFNFEKAFEDSDFWLEGDPETAFDKVNATIITKDLALKYFPDAVARGESLLGKHLLLNNKDPLEITGVLNDPPANTTLLFDMLIPYRFFAMNNTYRANNWSGNYQGSTYVRLPGGMGEEDLQAQLPAFKRKYLSEDDDQRIEYRLQHLSEIHTSDEYGTSIKSYVVTREILAGLVVIAVFLLVIASVNYVNLATVQSIKRSREVGIRKVLGSSKTSLRLQFLTETFILVLVAVIHGYAFAQLVIRELNSSLTIIHLELATDSQLFLVIAVFVVLLTLLAGFYPALLMSGYSPVQALKKKVYGGHRNVLRNVLVVVQFAIVQLLIVSTVIVAWQMNYFRSKDLGYDSQAILTFNVPDQHADKLQRLETRLMQHNAIEKVSFASGIPSAPDWQYGTDFRLSHEPVQMQRGAEMKVVRLDYLDMYQLELVAGRWLNEDNITEDNSFNGFVVNESLARMLNLTPEELLGREVIINEGQAPVVGVVRDFHNHDLHYEITPCLLFYWNVGFFTEGSVKFNTTANTAELIKFVDSAWRDVYPENIFKYQFIDDYLEKNYRVEELIFGAFRVTSFIAILIGCLGLYGLSAFITEVRTKEIGIRRVLGANISGIVSLLSGYFVRLLLLSVVAGSLAAWVLMREWLNGFAHRIEPGAGIFLAGALITVLVALLTTSIKTIRVALANPADSLRYE